MILRCRSSQYPSRAVRTNLPSSWPRSITFLVLLLGFYLKSVSKILEDPQTFSSYRSWAMLSLSRHFYHPEAMFRSMVALHSRSCRHTWTGWRKHPYVISTILSTNQNTASTQATMKKLFSSQNHCNALLHVRRKVPLASALVHFVKQLMLIWFGLNFFFSLHLSFSVLPFLILMHK